MRKSDKKFDNELRKILTRFCDNELEKLEGFQWVTHTVNYPNIQSSLKVICVFDSNQSLNQFLESDSRKKTESQFLALIADLNVKLKNPGKQIVFDSEENCKLFNQGNWAERLA